MKMRMLHEHGQDSCAQKQKRVLLVVDDQARVRKMIKRQLQDHFDAVVTVGNSTEAEDTLSSEIKVTHIVCDNDLDPGEPLGVELLGRWREQYPQIQQAVLFTSSPPSEPHLPGIDAVVNKSAESREALLIALGKNSIICSADNRRGKDQE